MGLVLILLATVLVLAAAVAGLVVYVLRMAGRLPEVHPASFVARGGAREGQRVLVLLGDSITHGRVSASYAAMVSERLAPDWVVVNAGVNGELAWNALQRLDQVVACDPDAVAVLIGTNDTTASMSDEWGRRAMRRMGVPRLPDLEWYRECLTALVDGLGERTRARVAVISVPPIGHDRADPFFAQSVRTAAISDEVAAQAGVDLLPLHEVMVERLAELELPPTPPARRYLRVMYPAIFRRLLLGRSYTDIGKARGFCLHSDHLHLNERGAALVADLVEGWVGADQPDTGSS